MRRNLELTHGVLFSQRAARARRAGHRARECLSHRPGPRPARLGDRLRRCASCWPPTRKPPPSTSTGSSTRRPSRATPGEIVGRLDVDRPGGRCSRRLTRRRAHASVLSMYDYVIVGAGSAGCVLADTAERGPRCAGRCCWRPGRRTRRDCSPHPGRLRGQLPLESTDWDLGSEPEPGLRRPPHLPPARQDARRLLVDQRDDLHPRQPGRLRRVGPIPGWGWDDVLPVLPARRGQRARRLRATTRSAGRCACSRLARAHRAVARPSSTPASGRGLPRQRGLQRPRAGRRRAGTRSTHARRPRAGARRSPTCTRVMDRPNLTVETHVHAHRVLFDGTARRSASVGPRLSELLEFRAEREVIVSAGAYHSPQILLAVRDRARRRARAAAASRPSPRSRASASDLQDHPAFGRRPSSARSR